MYPRAYICLSLETSFPNDSQIPPFSPHLRYESRIIVVPSRFIDHPNFSPPFLHRRITNDIIIPLSSFTFFFFFSLSFNLLHPCLDTFARSPRGLHNGRLILDVPSNSSARLRLPPPSLSPSLPSFLSLVGLVQSRVAALKSDTQRFFGSESIEESFISESRPVIWLYGTRGGRLWVMDE